MPIGDVAPQALPADRWHHYAAPPSQQRPSMGTGWSNLADSGTRLLLWRGVDLAPARPAPAAGINDDLAHLRSPAAPYHHRAAAGSFYVLGGAVVEDLQLNSESAV